MRGGDPLRLTTNRAPVVVAGGLFLSDFVFVGATGVCFPRCRHRSAVSLAYAERAL